MSNTIIGLSGYAGSGKDTAAAVLIDSGFIRISFADQMREAALALDPFVVTDRTDGRRIRLSEVVGYCGWDEAKRLYPEVRRTLQRLGTEMGRNFLGEDIWVDAAFKRMDALNSNLPRGFVITDVRFPNEGRAIWNRLGTVIRIERDGYGPVNEHPSETAMDDFSFDARVTNDGTPEQLALKILAVAI